MNKQKSLRITIFIFIALAVAVLSSALVIIMISSMYFITDTILHVTMRPLAKTAAMSVQGNLRMLAGHIFLISDNKILSDPAESVERKQQILDIAGSGIEFAWLSLYSADGYLVTGNWRGFSEIHGTRLYTVMRDTENMAIDDVSINGTELEIVIGCPIMTEEKITYFLVGSYMYDVLSDILGYINISSDCTAYIVNGRGKYMAHQNIEKVRLEQTLFDDHSGTSELDEILSMMAQHQIGTFKYGSGKSQKIFSFAPIRGTNWHLVIEASRADFLYAINRGILTSIQLTLVFMVLFIILANVLVGRLLIRPLKIITGHAQFLRHGIFGNPLPHSLFNSNNEIGQLAGAFDSMSHSIEGVISDIETIARAAGGGNLNLRVDFSSLEGDYHKIVAEMNDGLNLTCSYLNAIPEAIALLNEKKEMLFFNRAMDEFINIHGMDAHDPMLLERLAGGGVGSNALEPRVTEIFSPDVVSPGLYTADIAIPGLSGADNYSLQLQRVGRESPKRDSLCVILLLSDVTQLTRAKLDAEAASKAKTEFLSRMSHEIHTPMNAIIGMTQIARNTDDTEKLRNCITMIECSSKKLMELISDILDFARLDSGKFLLDIADFSLAESIDTVMAAVLPDAREKNIKIALIAEGITHDNISADQSCLSQVLINLISNAVKFSPEGSEVRVTAQETAWEDGYGTYRFTVTDHGIGIGDEQMKKMFVPFEQADGSMTRSYGGVGLGLVICKNLVTMMGGVISLQSKMGEGSTFSFTIRCATQAVGKNTGASSDILTLDDYDFSGKRCLIVDDIDINREIVMELLYSTRLAMECAENGEDALNQFSAGTEGYFDVILMDIQMPVMDGCTATRLIRGLDREDAKSIPIIAMTANVAPEDLQLALESGMTAQLNKPIDLGVLLSILNEKIGR